MRSSTDDAIPRTDQIPREDWERFLDQFTEMNEGVACRVEVINSPDVGAQVLLDDRPLLAISLDDEAGAPQIVIECGDTGEDTPAAFRHILSNPTTLWARKTELLGWDALEIETSKSGAIIISINPHPGRGPLHLEELGRSKIRAG